MDKIVEEILQANPKTRSSDRHLILQVWQSMGLELTPEQEAVYMTMPTAETITRCRRKIQERGKYLATDSVRKHRKIKSQIIQQRIPKSAEVQPLFDNSDYEIKKYWV